VREEVHLFLPGKISNSQPQDYHVFARYAPSKNMVVLGLRVRNFNWQKQGHVRHSKFKFKRTRTPAGGETSVEMMLRQVRLVKTHDKANQSWHRLVIINQRTSTGAPLQYNTDCFPRGRLACSVLFWLLNI
jgi:hypothetical protein